MAKIMGIDGNSLLFRAYYAMPALTNKDGIDTGAVYGFLNMLVRVLEEQKPDYVAVAFDLPGKTFRHDTFSEYKAGRKETPEDLISQFGLLKEVLAAMDIPILEQERYEADDILGYLAKKAKAEQMEAVLITGDNDVLQLAGDGTTVMLTKRGITDTDELDAAGVEKKMGVTPQRIPDLKGLMGDNSDNLPGVPGVGPKTAVKLLDEYGTIENVLENAENVKGDKLKSSLIQYGDQALMCRDMAVIDPDVPHMPLLSEIAYRGINKEKAYDTMKKYGFSSLMKRLEMEPVLGEQQQEKRQRKQGKVQVELKDLDAAIAAGKEAGRFALQFTTDALELAGDGFVYRTPLRQTLIDEGMEWQDALAVLKPLLTDEGIEKVVLDAKALSHALGAAVENAQDVTLAAYVCDPMLGKKDLEALYQRYDIVAEGADGMEALMEDMATEMAENGLTSVYQEMELPLWPVLYDMEAHGFRVDVDFLKEMGRQYTEKIKELEAHIYQSVGKEFNINSPKQLGVVLFEDLGLPVVKTTAKSKGYSTDVEVLEQLSDKHEVVSWVLDYRKAAKLKSTYLDGLVAMADLKDQRIHTRFTQNVTATGRLSSIEPNLQNIPVRTEEGREIRRAFLAYDDTRTLVVADYSQIELRILAHMAQDEAMLDIFNHGGDIHTDTAARVFGVPREEVTGEMRSAAKAVNFGIVYGISDFGLAKNIGVSRQKAAEYIDTYFARFPGVKAYLDQSVADATEHGYAETLFGRRRYMPELKSKNYNQRNFGKRVAMNAPIQGTAADIIKLAMIRVYDELAPYGEDATLILQVHDELIVDCKKEISQEIAELLDASMEGITSLSVPLVADVGIGDNWLSAK
ncbi:DNA polymerase I [Eubacteriales bacterium OttesenSCG-928-M02]|nr:DNA polymerase I [Eubacteriales bacterium OttesenSCG-928-M02]